MLQQYFWAQKEDDQIHIVPMKWQRQFISMLSGVISPCQYPLFRSSLLNTVALCKDSRISWICGIRYAWRWVLANHNSPYTVLKCHPSFALLQLVLPTEKLKALIIFLVNRLMTSDSTNCCLSMDSLWISGENLVFYKVGMFYFMGAYCGPLKHAWGTDDWPVLQPSFISILSSYASSSVAMWSTTIATILTAQEIKQNDAHSFQSFALRVKSSSFI